MKEPKKIIVFDLGNNNQSLVRMVRDEEVYCELHPYTANLAKIGASNALGFLFAGNAGASLTEERIAAANAILALGKPVLGIGFGKVLLAKLNGEPEPFSVTNDVDKDTLSRFLFETAGATKNWTMSEFVAKTVADIQQKVGNKKVLCAMSGGVDSAVCAALVHRAVGSQLTCVLVDHGLMRKNECEEVLKVFRDGQGMNLYKIDAADRFLGKLEGVTDPERKRKIIGEEFIRVFEDESKHIGHVDFLVQGTIYPDIIESGFGSALVKSHHNVGGLPSVIDFEEILEPVKDLFKDEVRRVGFELGLPKEIVMRQPFPGPGLGIRVIGDLTKAKLDLLRDADAILREEIANHGLDTEIWQYFAVLTSMKSVGVKNDARTYDYTIALRAVNSVDAMTADWARIPYPVLQKISERIVLECEGINRVVYDITSKPPATIEWE